jgi:hypothetical protein
MVPMGTQTHLCQLELLPIRKVGRGRCQQQEHDGAKLLLGSQDRFIRGALQRNH